MQINLYEVFSNSLEKEIIDNLMIKEIKFGNQEISPNNGITIKAKLQKLNDDEFMLSGSLNATFLLNCDRCNDEVNYPLNINFSKMISLDLEDEVQEDYINGHYLNLKDFVLNEIYLNFPMKVLCKEDCKGICKQCGINLNTHSCNCKNDDIDPRLLGLKAIFDENFKEV